MALEAGRGIDGGQGGGGGEPGGRQDEDEAEGSSQQHSTTIKPGAGARGSLSRNGMLDLIPRRGKVKLDAVSVLVALQALGLDGVRAPVEDETVLDGQGLVLHDVELPVIAARPVTDLAGDAFGLEVGRLIAERGMALEALGVLGGLADVHGLGVLSRLRRREGLEGLGVFAGLPKRELASLGLRLVTYGTLLGADISEVLPGKGDSQSQSQYGERYDHDRRLHGSSRFFT